MRRERKTKRLLPFLGVYLWRFKKKNKNKNDARVRNDGKKSSRDVSCKLWRVASARHLPDDVWGIRDTSTPRGFLADDSFLVFNQRARVSRSRTTYAARNPRPAVRVDFVFADRRDRRASATKIVRFRSLSDGRVFRTDANPAARVKKRSGGRGNRRDGDVREIIWHRRRSRRERLITARYRCLRTRSPRTTVSRRRRTRPCFHPLSVYRVRIMTEDPNCYDSPITVNGNTS